MTLERPVVIVGAGLAGLATALRLADAGRASIVLETRRFPGGRAASFVDARSGLTLDCCQHVLMGGCTHLIDLYDRLGVLDSIEWNETLHWTAGRGLIEPLGPRWLPAPLHLALAFQRLGIYDRGEKRAIARGMWRIMRTGTTGRPRWRGRTFAEFLAECGQPENVVRRFWGTIIVSACNLSVDRVDAAVALQVFQEGFLAGRFAATMGVPTVPLSELYAPAKERIEAAGGELRLGTTARSIAYNGDRVSGVVTDDAMIDTSWVVSAVPFGRLKRLVSDTLIRAEPRLARLDALTTSPILGVHLIFAQRVLDVPHLVLVDSPVHWLFSKGTTEAGEQHLHAVISAADDWMERDEETIIATVREEIDRILPAARGVELRFGRAIKERNATFAAVAGVDDLRPAVQPATVGLGRGGVANLLLTGDWVNTGWPATMESAVRSGNEAAAVILDEPGEVDDLPVPWLVRLLGR